jgi:hypothetical protein
VQARVTSNKDDGTDTTTGTTHVQSVAGFPFLQEKHAAASAIHTRCREPTATCRPLATPRQHDLPLMSQSTGVKRLGCGCNPGHAGVTGSIPTTVGNCGLYILGRLSVTSAQVASRQGGGGLGGLPLFMCPHVIIIQACVSRPQTAPPSQGAGPMGGILWRYGAKGGPYGLLLLLLLLCHATQNPA